MNDGLRIFGLLISWTIQCVVIVATANEVPPLATVGMVICAAYLLGCAMALVERANKPIRQAEEDLIYAQIFKEDL